MNALSGWRFPLTEETVGQG